MDGQQLMRELLDGGDGRRSLFGMRNRLYDAVRPLAEAREWEAMLALAHDSAQLLAPDARAAVDDPIARSMFESALDVAFADAVGRVEAFAATTPIKAMYSEYIEGWQPAGMVGITGIFLCDQDESDCEDWPAFFVDDVQGPDWEPVVRGWLNVDLGESASAWHQLAHLALVASFGRAWHRQPRGIPFFFAEHGFDPIALAR